MGKLYLYLLRVLSVTQIIKQVGVAVMLGIFNWEVPSLNLNCDAVYPHRIFFNQSLLPNTSILAQLAS